jgi:D-amino-acid oxidase
VDRTRIIVVGAGIVGLTSAVRLAEAGYEVAVVARDLPLETTSAIAAALWYPYRAEPPDQVLAWARASFSAYASELPDRDSGVNLVDGLELRRSAGEPWFAAALPDVAGFSHFQTVPEGYVDGWQLRLPVIEPSIYLPRLVSRLESLGGSLSRMVVSALPTDAVVVSCVGLAARSLASDASVTPVRGQVVRVERTDGVDAWLLDQSDEDAPIYVVPRSRDVVVGGTAEVGSFDQQPHESITASIMSRAARLVPPIATATVLGTAAGLRPSRPCVRLESEQQPRGGLVVHNYGHGGAGWTLAWGCADDVVAEVAAFTQ